MGAGIPAWSKLNAMGKLPENQKHQVPYLGDVTKLEEEIASLKKKNQTLQGQLTKLKKETTEKQASVKQPSQETPNK